MTHRLTDVRPDDGEPRYIEPFEPYQWEGRDTATPTTTHDLLGEIARLEAERVQAAEAFKEIESFLWNIALLTITAKTPPLMAFWVRQARELLGYDAARDAK